MVLVQNDGVPESLLLAIRSPMFKKSQPVRPKPRIAHVNAATAPRGTDGVSLHKIEHRWWGNEKTPSSATPQGRTHAYSASETAHFATDGQDEVTRVVDRRVRQRDLERAQKDRDMCQERVDRLMDRLKDWAGSATGASKKLTNAQGFVDVSLN